MRHGIFVKIPAGALSDVLGRRPLPCLAPSCLRSCRSRTSGRQRLLNLSRTTLIDKLNRLGGDEAVHAA